MGVNFTTDWLGRRLRCQVVLVCVCVLLIKLFLETTVFVAIIIHTVVNEAPSRVKVNLREKKRYILVVRNIGHSERSILHRKPCNYLESHVTHLENHAPYLESHVCCAFFDASGKLQYYSIHYDLNLLHEGSIEPRGLLNHRNLLNSV